MIALKRITKEYNELKKYIENESVDNHRILHLNTIEDNILDLEIYFLGPNESPYEEIVNKIYIKIPNEYPNKAPYMIFKNKIYHPNISIDGNICLDILKDKWSPVYTIRTVILSIISLLSDPNPDSPLNGQAAQLYKESKKAYNKMVLKNDY
jgi:hypothetical protein